MKYILRDDDVTYLTDPKDLELIYRNIPSNWKVWPAIIPCIKTKSFNTPPKLNKLSDNIKLIKYLKAGYEKGRFIPVQHGYSHDDKDGKYEFENDDYNYLVNICKEGKSFLESIFKIPFNTFVAPHDRFSRNSIKAIEDSGFMTISRLICPLPREIQTTNILDIDLLKLCWHILTHGTFLRYPYSVKIGKHQEIYSYRLEEINEQTISTMFKYLTKINNVETVFSITIHHNDWSETKLKKLLLLIRTLQEI